MYLKILSMSSTCRKYCDIIITYSKVISNEHHLALKCKTLENFFWGRKI